MELSQVGPLVRAQRKACGLSQKDVARLAGLSRATINYLENDPAMDLGAAKLLVVLRILGITVTARPARPDDDARLLEDALGLAGGERTGGAITSGVLVEAIVTGRPPLDHAAALTEVLTATDPAVIVGAVRLATATGEVSAKQAWRHLRALASSLDISGPSWTKA